MKKLLLIAAVLGVFFYLNRERPEAGYAPQGTSEKPAAESAALSADDGPGTADDPIAEAYESRASGVLVSGRGQVTRVLGDDSLGDRHQRFILELDSGQTLLIAHNIDLAPRVEGLREGDLVEFSGEYEWNDKGGVVHWTHHDPNGQRTGGWIRHDGRTYE
jgi:hypothetical protein